MDVVLHMWHTILLYLTAFLSLINTTLPPVGMLIAGQLYIFLFTGYA